VAASGDAAVSHDWVETMTSLYVAIGRDVQPEARTSQKRLRSEYQSRPKPSSVECCQAMSAPRQVDRRRIVSVSVDSSNLTWYGRTIRYGSGRPGGRATGQKRSTDRLRPLIRADQRLLSASSSSDSRAISPSRVLRVERRAGFRTIGGRRTRRAQRASAILVAACDRASSSWLSNVGVDAAGRPIAVETWAARGLDRTS